MTDGARMYPLGPIKSQSFQTILTVGKARRGAFKLCPRGTASRLGPRLPRKYLVAALSMDDYRVAAPANRARVEGLASVARRVTLAEGDNPVLEPASDQAPGGRPVIGHCCLSLVVYGFAAEIAPPASGQLSRRVTRVKSAAASPTRRPDYHLKPHQSG